MCHLGYNIEKLAILLGKIPIHGHIGMAVVVDIPEGNVAGVNNCIDHIKTMNLFTMVEAISLNQRVLWGIIMKNGPFY